MAAVAILAQRVEDTEGQACVLTEVEAPPEELVDYIQGRVSTYILGYSKAV